MCKRSIKPNNIPNFHATIPNIQLTWFTPPFCGENGFCTENRFCWFRTLYVYWRGGDLWSNDAWFCLCGEVNVRWLSAAALWWAIWSRTLSSADSCVVVISSTAAISSCRPASPGSASTLLIYNAIWYIINIQKCNFQPEFPEIPSLNVTLQGEIVHWNLNFAILLVAT